MTRAICAILIGIATVIMVSCSPAIEITVDVQSTSDAVTQTAITKDPITSLRVVLYEEGENPVASSTVTLDGKQEQQLRIPLRPVKEIVRGFIGVGGCTAEIDPPCVQEKATYLGCSRMFELPQDDNSQNALSVSVDITVRERLTICPVPL